jgi:dTMP kinase
MSASPPRSRFVTFEGLEGTGKSTQIERLARALERAGESVVVTREPGGTALGRRLRAVLLEPTDRPMHPWVELLLYTADRAQHLSEVVLPARERGAVVLCDRYLDASLAYQGHARGLGFEAVLALHRDPPLDTRPDRTLLLDMDAAASLARARRRNAASAGQASEGRFEAEELAFHERVREGYLELARRDSRRIVRIDAAPEPDAVARAVIAALSDLIPALGRES